MPKWLQVSQGLMPNGNPENQHFSGPVLKESKNVLFTTVKIKLPFYDGNSQWKLFFTQGPRCSQGSSDDENNRHLLDTCWATSPTNFLQGCKEGGSTVNVASQMTRTYTRCH